MKRKKRRGRKRERERERKGCDEWEGHLSRAPPRVKEKRVKVDSSLTGRSLCPSSVPPLVQNLASTGGPKPVLRSLGINSLFILDIASFFAFSYTYLLSRSPFFSSFIPQVHPSIYPSISPFILLASTSRAFVY